MTDPSTKERLARAAEKHMFAPHELPVSDELHENYLSLADALLTTLETPTPEMIEAGAKAAYLHRWDDATQCRWDDLVGNDLGGLNGDMIQRDFRLMSRACLVAAIRKAREAT